MEHRDLAAGNRGARFSSSRAPTRPRKPRAGHPLLPRRARASRRRRPARLRGDLRGTARHARRVRPAQQSPRARLRGARRRRGRPRLHRAAEWHRVPRGDLGGLEARRGAAAAVVAAASRRARRAGRAGESAARARRAGGRATPDASACPKASRSTRRSPTHRCRTAPHPTVRRSRRAAARAARS